MNIILIGAGRLATQLGTSLISSGHTILQIYSPTKTSASQLADKINAPYTTCLQSIDRNADLYIIAIKDNALYEILKGLPIPVNPYSCVVHTAGSVHPLRYILSTSNFFKRTERRFLSNPLFYRGL